MKPSTTFCDSIATRYARKHVADETAYARKPAISRDSCAPDSEILESSCGSGSVALAHAPYMKRVHALDFSSNMIAIANAKRTAAEITNEDFECGCIDAFEPAPQRYDIVLALNVLHLLDDWRTVIGRVHKLLPPGGVLITSTACIRDMLPGLRFVAPLGHALGLLPNLARFTHEALRPALERAGFVIDCAWQPGRRQPVFIVARKPAREGTA